MVRLQGPHRATPHPHPSDAHPAAHGGNYDREATELRIVLGQLFCAHEKEGDERGEHGEECKQERGAHNLGRKAGHDEDATMGTKKAVRKNLSGAIHAQGGLPLNMDISTYRTGPKCIWQVGLRAWQRPPKQQSRVAEAPATQC